MMNQEMGEDLGWVGKLGGFYRERERRGGGGKAIKMKMEGIERLMKKV